MRSEVVVPQHDAALSWSCLGVVRLPFPATMTDTTRRDVLRFGSFELDLTAEELVRNGRTIRLQPQPFRLLRLLATQPGKLVTREEIQAALWTTDTFVDFEQGVNFAVKQVREALGDRAEDPVYIQTVPKRGYRFVAPVGGPSPVAAPIAAAPPQLDRALWENIVDLRLAEARRRTQLMLVTAAVIGLAILVVVLLFVRR